MQTPNKHITTEIIQDILSNVFDPEIPVISVIDLGVLRKIEIDDHVANIFITPTYSGCPAMDVITMQIGIALENKGIKNYNIVRQLSPAWTTDWITEKGRQALLAYGIAPPQGKVFDKSYLENLRVSCPLCRSSNTALLSEFGSTACKALYRCNDCLEPFDYFKCH